MQTENRERKEGGLPPLNNFAPLLSSARPCHAHPRRVRPGRRRPGRRPRRGPARPQVARRPGAARGRAPAGGHQLQRQRRRHRRPGRLRRVLALGQGGRPGGKHEPQGAWTRKRERERERSIGTRERKKRGARARVFSFFQWGAVPMAGAAPAGGGTALAQHQSVARPSSSPHPTPAGEGAHSLVRTPSTRLFLTLSLPRPPLFPQPSTPQPSLLSPPPHHRTP